MGIWTRVNGTGSTAGGTSAPLQASLSLTAGNLLVVAMANNGTFLTPSDGANTYVKLGQMAVGTADLTLYYSIITSGGTKTIGAASSNVGAMGITQFNPGGGPITVDDTAVTNNGSSASPTSGNIPCTVGDLIVGGYGGQSTSTFSPTSPTVADFNVAEISSHNFAGALLYNLSASANPSVLSGTITSSIWAFVGAAFKSGPVGYSVSGPSSGNNGAASTNFTLTPNASTTDTVTPSDGGAGGTFTPSSFTFSSGTAQTFTYTPDVSGAISLTFTSANGGAFAGAPLSYTSFAYTLTGPPSGTGLGASSNFTITPVEAITDTVTPSDGGAGGTFTPSSLSWTASATAKTCTYTPPRDGAFTLTFTSTAGGPIAGSPHSYTAIVTYTLSGPIDGFAQQAVTFTITPAEATTDTITLSDGGAGGTFTPTSLSWTNSSTPKTFTYASPSAGTFSLTATSGASESISGSPLSFFASGITVGAYVCKSGKLAIFDTASSTTQTNGVFNPAYVVSVNSSPTIKVNGHTLTSLGPATFQSQGFNTNFPDAPFVAYLLNCGSVQSIPMSSGGTTSFTAASASWDGTSGGGTGLTLGTPVLASGIISYTIPHAGFGLANGTFQLPIVGGTNTVAATALVTISGGSVASVVPLTGGVLGYGAGYSGSVPTQVAGSSAPNSSLTSAAVTLTGTVTSGSAVVTGLSSTSGFGAGATAVSSGNIPSSTTVSTIDSSTQVTLSAAATTTGSISIVFQGPNASITCTIGNYVQSVPVMNGGSGFTSPPTITIHDTGSGTGAVAAPIMSGPLSSDVLTYSAASQWLTTALSFIALGGNITSGSPTVTGMTTSSLSVGDTASCPGFIPLNTTVAAINSGSSITLSQNAIASTSSGATIYFGVPLNTASASSAPMTNQVGVLEESPGHLSGFRATPTMLLGANAPSQQSGAATVFMAKNKMLCSAPWKMGSGATSLTFDSLWNPASWTPGGTITASPYTGGAQFPFFMGVFTLQYDDAFYAGGAPAATTVNLVSFDSTSNITLISHTVSGTTVTNTYNVSYPASPPASYAPNLQVNLIAPSDGLYHLSNIWLFAPGNTIDRSNRYALDDNMVAFLTGPTGRGPAVMRFMDSINGFAGLSNWIDPSDIQNPNNASWFTQYTNPQWSPIGSNNNKSGTAIASAARFLNTNAASTTYPWSTTNVYSSQPWALSGTDDFGNYLSMIDGPLGANDNGTLMYPNFGHLAQVVCVELVFPTPHGIKTNQLVSMVHPIFNATYTAGSPNVTITGPNSSTPGASMSNVLAGMPISGPGIVSTVTLTGTLTAGSPTVTGLSGSGGLTTSAFIAGALVGCPNFLQGQIGNTNTLSPTFVQAVNSSSSITLSLNATASGTVAITFTAAPTTIVSVNSPTSITMSANSTFTGSTVGSSPATLTINSIVPTTSSGNVNITGNSQAYATGPNTLAVYPGVANFASQQQQFVTASAFGGPATAEIPIYLAVQLTEPLGEGLVPAEFAASAVSYFPNCALWFNLSYLGSDAFYELMAQKVAAHIGPTNDVIVEFGNEHWNAGSDFVEWLVEQFMARVPAYLPAGTQLWDFENTSSELTAYTVTNGTALANSDFAYALRTAHAFYVFKQAAIAAGIDASRIKCSFGSWYAGSGVTQNLATMFTTYDFPMDSVHIAPYSGDPATLPLFAAACSPAGATVTNTGVAITPGNWPVDAMNDYYRHAQFYSSFYWTSYGNHQAILGPLGVPLVAYESAVQNTVPTETVDYQALSTDCTSHPSYHDNQWCYYLSMQYGSQTNQYPGLTLANYFSLYLPFSPYAWATNFNNIWKLGDGISQPPGSGSSNLFLTPQGGAPGTRFALGYSETNTSPALQAMIDWNGLTTPFFAPDDTVLTPTDGTTGLATSAIASIQFNEPMLSSSLTTSTFTLKNGATTIAGTVSYDFDFETATYTPTSALTTGVTYTAQATTGVQNAEGTSLASPITWSFTVGQPIPSVTATTPASGATTVSATAAITATFSQSMNVPSLALSLSPATAIFAPTYNSSTNVATWVPVGLQYNTAYTATLDGTSLAGAPMASPEVWSFTTSDAPPSGAGAIPAIGFQFAAPIVADTVVFTVTVSATNASVPGTTSYSSGTRTATFTPTNPFVLGTKYIVVVSRAIDSENGTMMSPATFTVTPGTQKTTGWFAGLSRQLG
jgi:hypothetical protein